MDNGIFSITIASPQGTVTGIEFNGIDNILKDHNGESDRGYEIFLATPKSAFLFLPKIYLILKFRKFYSIKKLLRLSVDDCRYWDVNWSDPKNPTDKLDK